MGRKPYRTATEKEITRLKKQVRNNNYQKETRKIIAVSFNKKTESDILDWIQSQDSVHSYIARLVRDDMELKKGNKNMKNKVYSVNYTNASNGHYFDSLEEAKAYFEKELEAFGSRASKDYPKGKREPIECSIWECERNDDGEINIVEDSDPIDVFYLL